MPDINSDAIRHYKGKSCESERPDVEPRSLHVVLGVRIDLTLLRKQKRALLGIREGEVIRYEQEEAVEGVLNPLDFIQDSILEQGLATEEEVFPQLPQLFEQEPKPGTGAF